MQLPISVFIIAKNEADRIATTINSVKGWAGEVIVIDSGSTDNTVAVAQALGARVLFNAWNGYGLQKRFGEEQCTHDWLINLDADEEITPQLAKEIQELFAGEPAAAGYILKVRDLLPGEKKLALGAHKNSCLRLYNKKFGRFSDSPVHDSVIMESGEVGQLKNPVLHRSFRSIAHALEKMNDYTSAQALNLQKKGLALAEIRLWFEYPFALFKGLFLRMYILRGWRGLVFAHIYALSRVVRIAKYLEMKN